MNSLQAADSRSKNSIAIQFDRGVMKRKKVSKLDVRNLVILLGQSDTIEEAGDKVKLMLEQDTIAYAIGKFRECLETNKFEPAELCELSIVGGRDSDNDLYCILLK